MDAAKDPNSIGNVLIKLGYCTQGDIDQAKQRMEELRMGETLVAMDVIDGAQLDHALKLQRMHREEMTPAEERAFAREQRQALVTELSEINGNAMAFVAKVNGG
jgi:hypothetical protein